MILVLPEIVCQNKQFVPSETVFLDYGRGNISSRLD